MLVSILHRATGVALSLAGLALLTWWLLALAGGADSYAAFSSAAKHPLGLLVLFGLTWAFFQHTASGIRHLIMDAGAGLEINFNKKMAFATLASSFLFTAVLWAFILLVRA